MRDEHPLDDPLLADLLAELRSWGAGPAPVPSTALATLLADACHPDPVPPPIRRKKMLVSRLAGLGIAAKVALGAGVAAAAVTTAGVGGVLPAPAQHGVAIVVNAVSPIDIPDVVAKVDVAGTDVSAAVTAAATDDSADDPAGDDPAGDPAGDDGGEHDAATNHGACVSAIAQDGSLTGREHGQAVSEVAKSDCGKADDETTSTTTPTTTTSIPAGGDEDGEDNLGHGPDSDHGNGNGNQGAGGGSGRSGSGSGR